MMVERHYDDEALISLMETGRVASDAHLPACKACSEKLQSFRGLAGVLHDATVWDRRPLNEEPVRSTIATLRAFADRMTDEDTRAEAYLRDLLAGPREEWMPRLEQHPEYRTAGVVRKLIAASDRAIDTMPPDAVEITRLATDIADHLDPATQPSDTVARLRGAAWRDRAYALFYTGDFTEAERAICRSERHFSDCVVDEYELARVGIVKALVLRALEEYASASAAATQSVQTFLRFEDMRRSSSAVLAEVHLLFSRGEFEQASFVLLDVERRLRDTSDVETHARVLGNLGYCWRKMGKIEQAISSYDMSTALFEDLEIATEAVRNRWSAAAIVVAAGRLDEAHRRLTHVRARLDELGMKSEAGLAALDIAEVLLAKSEFAAVEEICRAAMQSFEAAGLSYSSRALTAIAFIEEAARERKASQVLVQSVRKYIERLPEQPNLLFAPPPS